MSASSDGSPYQPLFKIEVEHTFFAAGGCRALRFEPTASSRYLLEKMGCVVRSTACGLQVWRTSPQDASAQNAALPSRPDSEPLYLDFLVYSRDPLFGSYTLDLPAPDGSVPLFDSAPFRPTDADGRTRLHDAKYVSKSDLHSIATLVLNNVLARREGLLPPTFVVRISLASLRGYGPSGRCYYVRFGATATLWKYYLPGDWPRDSVQVIDIGGEIDFDPAVVESLPNGRAALTVRSRTEIELRERSSRRFQLRLRDGVAEKVIIKRLPVAGATEQYAETIDSIQKRVSHIHVGC